MPNWNLIGSLVLPNVGGWLGTLTMIGQVKKPDGKAWYQLIKKPTWTAPDWVFGPAWTALYTGMGYASYLVYKECGGLTVKALVPLSLYGAQLIFNWTWTPIFFGLHKIQFAYFHMLALDATVVATAISFGTVNTTAAILMLPYMAWLGYATCLNRAIWKLNKDSDEDKKPIV